MNIKTADQVLSLLVAGLLAWLVFGLAHSFARTELDIVWSVIPGNQGWAFNVVAFVLAVAVFARFEGLRLIAWLQSKMKGK